MSLSDHDGAEADRPSSSHHQLNSPDEFTRLADLCFHQQRELLTLSRMLATAQEKK